MRLKRAMSLKAWERRSRAEREDVGEFGGRRRGGKPGAKPGAARRPGDLRRGAAPVRPVAAARPGQDPRRTAGPGAAPGRGPSPRRGAGPSPGASRAQDRPDQSSGRQDQRQGRLDPRAARREQREDRVQQRLWSEAVALGENLQIQAADGYRGAVLELRPGLYLVAELRAEGLGADDFGRAVQPREVTQEIVRVTDRALDSMFPARRTRKQTQQEQAQRGADLARREREHADRQRAEQQRVMQQQQAQRALPAPKALPPGTARWLDDEDEELDDAELIGCPLPGERRR